MQNLLHSKDQVVAKFLDGIYNNKNFVSEEQVFGSVALH